MNDNLDGYVSRLGPRNWQELADAGKFLRGFYAEALRTVANDICILEGEDGLRGVSAARLQEATERFESFNTAYQDANLLYLGARASAIEERPGNFDTGEQIPLRIEEAMLDGVLIENFVSAARTITAINLSPPADEVSPRVEEARDVAAQNIFDKSLGIIRQIEAAGSSLLYPKTETVVAIVREEIGVLTDPVRQIIVSVMEFKPR